MFRNALAPAARRSAATRSFHASLCARKTAAEKVAEVADKVNKTVGQGLASAIEKGEGATESTKETMGSASAKTKEASHAAAQKANQTAAGARAGTNDFKKDVEKEARK